MDFFHTHVSARCSDLVAAVLASGFLSEGKMVRKFEEALAGELGLSMPVALNSGTSALHLALVLAEAGAGDEIIIPPQTFVATGLAVLMCGAKPVFCDIQRDTGNMSPESFRSHITSRTKAVIPVHWAGCPCDLAEISTIAAQHGITVVEDAAHALGASYNGKPIGAISRFTAFSFQAIKHLTTGDGGALCCAGADDREEARRLRWFGIDRDRDRPSPLGERKYNLRRAGYKYHMNDVAAAIGLGNLPDIPANVRRHQGIASTYARELADVPGLTRLRTGDDRTSACWIWTALVDRRDDFCRAMGARGIPVSVVHQRIDRNDVLGGLDNDLVEQAFFDAHQVALPVHAGLTDEDVGAVVHAVRQGW